ncbi:hypothetical protein NDU88_003354 [Pleurodeles waltl]|uniref:Uncharacterized protein n=1 Tax=Pleurodeles waltl TaxID=8319 RepID=A0AAV7NL78_PLEWA|nr:hypothetical protein NDU88_003354 [Pleurodeles waltl]
MKTHKRLWRRWRVEANRAVDCGVAGTAQEAASGQTFFGVSAGGGASRPAVTFVERESRELVSAERGGERTS